MYNTCMQYASCTVLFFVMTSSFLNYVDVTRARMPIRDLKTILVEVIVIAVILIILLMNAMYVAGRKTVYSFQAPFFRRHATDGR